MNSTGFFTDKYEMTMLQAALKSGKAFEKMVFELFARKLPEGRRYGVVGGMERAIDAVENFKFSSNDIDYLREDPQFSEETLLFLRNYSFRGSISGYREGSLYFPYSPILTVEGTFADSVLLETVLLSILNHDSAVMSAASRMVQAAGEVPIIEMGSRRTHENAAVDSARAAYISGFSATSNMEAGRKYGVPTTGTSAHAFTLAFANEIDAFRAQIDALGVGTTLLVDTYDIAQGIKNAIEVAGPNLGGIRIDSGDLHEETVKARELLNELGAVNTKIVLSSDIDEYSIDEMLDKGTPIDGIGAGTRVVTGSGYPTAGMVFKLVAREGKNRESIPVAKKSSGKKSIGGRKYVYRDYVNGFLEDEYFTFQEKRGKKSVQLNYFSEGERVHNPVSLHELRDHHREEMESLPVEARRISAGTPYLEANLKMEEK